MSAVKSLALIRKTAREVRPEVPTVGKTKNPETADGQVDTIERADTLADTLIVPTMNTAAEITAVTMIGTVATEVAAVPIEERGTVEVGCQKIVKTMSLQHRVLNPQVLIR